ncbi:uncharacterized protein [Macrobrachium rosenbergii]|uniref:uncharacterized protein n=1 Tax=Macrobrachium rosenbergii TaxID=79674 RepID=UPI0034D463ED
MQSTVLWLVTWASVVATQFEGIVEDEITKILREFLRQYDPYRVPYVDDLHFVLEDGSDIHLAFKHAHLEGFSVVNCTGFSPPIFGSKVALQFQMERLRFPAEHYSADGTLKSQPYSAAGEGEMVAHLLTGDISFDTDAFSLSPLSVCAKDGTLDIDLSVARLEGIFENGEELSAEFEAYGSVLIDDLQNWLLQYSRFLVALFNNFMCHS